MATYFTNRLRMIRLITLFSGLGLMELAYGANIFYTPMGSQLDGDPIHDLAVPLLQETLHFDVIFDPTGVVLPILPFDDVLIEWGFTFDDEEIGLFNNTNPSPTVIVGMVGEVISTLSFAVGNIGEFPDDGLSDFAIEVTSVLYRGPFGDFDATFQFLEAGPVDIQQPRVPEPVTLSLISLGLAGMASLRKTKGR